MNEPRPEPGEIPDRSRFSGFHARTFEAELLISGAVVFALVQLPPEVARFFEAMLVRLEGNLRMVAVYGLTYVQLMIFVLIAAFVIHLVLRAYWIGLVGLESVYPGGVRWDSLKAGPHFIEYGRKRLPKLGTTIDRVDDLCSLIFSFGFMLVIVFLYSVALVMVTAVVALLLSRLLFAGESFAPIFWTCLGAVLGIQIVSGLADRVLGPKLGEGGLGARVIALMIRVSYHASPLRWMGPIQLTLQSNTSTTRVSVTQIAVMVLLTLGAMGTIFVRAGIVRFDSLIYFPDSLREVGVDPRHYRDQRPANALEPRYPSIQSEVVGGPYLKLVIPYYPRIHNPLMREHCPDVAPLDGGGLVFGRPKPPKKESAQAASLCFVSIFVIALDGEPLEAPQLEFTRQPGSGLAAVAAYISTADLAPGRHELTVEAPSRAMAEGEADAEPVRHLIPFWR